MTTLNEMVSALDASQLSLRRDACSDYRISGKHGHVYADGGGFLLCVSGGGAARWWTNVKQRLSFCRVTQDGHDEGCLYLDRLPAPAEAELIRDAIGIRRKRHLSPEALAKAMAALRLVNGPVKTPLGGSTFAETGGAVSYAAALNSEIAKLRAERPAQPPPPKDEGVRIVQLVEPSNFVRPTSKELRKLYDVVLARYPQLAPRLTARWADDERREHYDGYVWSFERCGFLGRTAAPDTRRYVNHWIEETKDWLRLHRPAHSGSIGAGFLVAMLAHGDIPYTVGDENRGVVWAVGVTPFGGAKATDAWRRVLDGQLMAPVAPERRFA